jgi:hypothetical protein
MRASKVSARQWPGGAALRSQKDYVLLGVPITILILVNCIPGRACATDLVSSQAGYVLTPAGNPYNVVAGANIDTRVQSSNAIYGDINHAGSWALTNNGTVNGGHFAVQFNSPAVIVNNGSTISETTTAIALYSGGYVTNSAGASIVGHLDGVFANSADSSVTNAGDIGGSPFRQFNRVFICRAAERALISPPEKSSLMVPLSSPTRRQPFKMPGLLFR